MSEIDLDELRAELNDFAKPAKAEGGSAKEQRIIAGFEEIERFVAAHGRPPQHGEDRDIFERIYAVRLDRLRASGEYRAVLKARDPSGLLELKPSAKGDGVTNSLREDRAEYRVSRTSDDEPSDEELLAALAGGENSASDIKELRHVRSREEIRAAEEVAQRNPCENFADYEPIFAQVQEDLKTGQRITVKFKDNAEVSKGDLFILEGQKVLVAEEGEPFVSDYGRPDRRLRVIYDNGTENDLLVRSLQRALNKDKASRRITTPDLGPLFSDEMDEADLPSGSIYVLRSKSAHPFIAEHRTVIHKIGVTGGDLKRRIVNAEKDPTFLLAGVDIVAVFELANINRARLEAILHRFFASARLDLDLMDRFGGQVEPREWFLVPLPAIEEAIKRIVDGSIERYRYDPETAGIVER